MRDIGTERIGEIFIKLGLLTQQQVEEILTVQKDRPDQKFGMLALELGYIGDEAINAYINYIENLD